MFDTHEVEFPYLEAVLSANRTWSDKVQEVEPKFFEESATGQAPKILWIGCSDSRVPESVLMARRPGDIFVHRNIANQFHKDDDSAISVLTYAVEHLGVEHVIVVGHTNCGGAAAAFDASSSASSSGSQCDCGSLSIPHGPTQHEVPLLRWLTPLTELAASLRLSTAPRTEAIQTLVDESVRKQVENVCGTDVMKGAWEKARARAETTPAPGAKVQKDVWVHGWVYELETGLLHDLHVSKGPKSE